MAVREVLLYPHPSLKAVAAPVDEAQLASVRGALDDLLETMRSFPRCVGIAAPQIDALVRAVIVDVTDHPKAPEDHNGEMVLVNPAIVESEGAEVGREGCLSIPDFTANVRRATRIVVAALDPEGSALRIESTGFEARCLQHEIDHLDGILFLDRVDSLTDDVFRRKNYG